MEGSGSGAPVLSLRDRKRERTRRALIDAAAALFERKGYNETTVAEIAAAADIGTRTFFSYFASKEDILFPDNDTRTQTTIQAIADTIRPRGRWTCWSGRSRRSPIPTPT
jgi:AcrR family transcriptional regulator